MKLPNERQALSEIVKLLSDLQGVSASDAVLLREPQPEVDAQFRLGDATFVVEWKGTSSLASVDRAARQVKKFVAEEAKDAVPLVAVPYMGPMGRERCEEVGVSWLDLSGNARIEMPGLRVRIEGQPNRFRRRGRPQSAFAPKSSRIARWLLMHPRSHVTQRELARATDMDEGYTSKIVSRLEEDDLILREEGGAIGVREPNLLLDAWREDYDFSRHEIVRGHVAARSGDQLLRSIAERLDDSTEPFAATGLSAAWLMNHFAGFRTVTIYLHRQLPPGVLDDLGFRNEERGSNVWLVVPNDAGVFHGAEVVEGILCVHPVQVYLDLMQHPERASESAAQIRADLPWNADA